MNGNLFYHERESRRGKQLYLSLSYFQLPDDDDDVNWTIETHVFALVKIGESRNDLEFLSGAQDSSIDWYLFSSLLLLRAEHTVSISISCYACLRIISKVLLTS